MSKDSSLETEAYNNHVAFSQSLLADQFKCTKVPEHALINWFSGDPPNNLIENNSSLTMMPSTSAIITPSPSIIAHNLMHDNTR